MDLRVERNTGIMGIANELSLMVSVVPFTDEVLYQYSDEDEHKEAKMEFDEKGELFFVSDSGIKYYISEFLRRNY